MNDDRAQEPTTCVLADSEKNANDLPPCMMSMLEAGDKHDATAKVSITLDYLACGCTGIYTSWRSRREIKTNHYHQCDYHRAAALMHEFANMPGL
jgi:hypothetical protein